jgi:hypothetical protein
MSPASRVSAATVAFVVPVKDDTARPQCCLGNIRAAAGSESRMVVGDQGPPDGPAAVARAAGARLIAPHQLEAAFDAMRDSQAGLAGGGARDHRAAPGRAEAAR